MQRSVRIGAMAAAMSVVREGDRWRIQIAWPNGNTCYFGKFNTEREALEWAYSHRWLTATK